MKLIATGCLLAGVLAVASAQSVTPIAPKKGAFAFNFMASYTAPQGGNTTTSIAATPMFFVTDNVALGVPFSWSHQSGFDSTSIGALARFYFSSMGNNLMKPFVGATYAVANQTGGTNNTMWGAQAGVDYFVANNVAVEGTFNWNENRQAGVSQNGWSLNFGFTIFFPGAK